MSIPFHATVSITGGTLRFSLYKATGHILVGSIQDNGTLDVPLQPNEQYFATYQVVSEQDGCKYSVIITDPPQARANIHITLKDGAIDFNSIPFTTPNN